MITIKPSGISLNNSNIYLSVPPTLNYLTLPSLNTYQMGFNILINSNNPANLTTTGTGKFTSLINGGFTLSAGAYVITFKTYMTQSRATAGYINYNTVGLSTTTSGFSVGCNCFWSGMMYFPASCLCPYILNTSTMILSFKPLHYIIIF